MFFLAWETCIWFSCTEFVYPECWHFDNDATSVIDDALTEHGGLLHVLPPAVHLRFVWLDKQWEPFWTILNLTLWDPSFMLQVWGDGVVANKILVSAQGPLVLGFELKGFRD